MKIGDFVTSCEAGYWQILDILPQIADSDYKSDFACWKKGETIGQWALLKKAFTPKMKPKIDFSYVNGKFLSSVSPETESKIRQYFADNPDFKEKFNSAEPKFRPMITNCWLNLPEDKEADFLALINSLTEKFTMGDLWTLAKDYKQYVAHPPASHLLNFLTYPWDITQNGDYLYSGTELSKI